MPEPLTPELEEIRDEVHKAAVDFGLDFFETIFEVVDYYEMNMVAAYTGFPIRYPHWRFGMEYESLSKSYAYGLSKIYEMVINTNPSYAYLLKGNHIIDQKLVMAHVFGHVDFFKNNVYFSHTNRKMVDEMANHATRVRRLIDRVGLDQVEGFLDTCLSIENLIDYHLPAMKRRPEREPGAPEEAPVVQKIKAKAYMDKFINPQAFLDAQQARITETATKAKKFPQEPEKDVLLFLLENAPLEGWERDVLEIVRDEAYYFAPQGMTKIMNEGWAVYWHSKILTERVLKPSEIIDYADHHSGVLGGSGRLNPYKLGWELYKHIEDRWNKGKFGPEYDQCDDMVALQKWDRKTGEGREKVFEVRKLFCDVTFIDEFLTREFAYEQKLFTYEYNRNSSQFEIRDREFQKIKQKLLFQLTNFGQPFIYVADGNFENRSELLLLHRHDGVDLDYNQARDTLTNVQRIWKRPVNIETVVDGKRTLLSYDGREHKERELEQLKLL